MVEAITLDAIFNKPRKIPAIVQKAIDTCKALPEGAVLDTPGLADAMGCSFEHFKKYVRHDNLAPFRFKVRNKAYYGSESTVAKAIRRKRA